MDDRKRAKARAALRKARSACELAKRELFDPEGDNLDNADAIALDGIRSQLMAILVRAGGVEGRKRGEG